MDLELHAFLINVLPFYLTPRLFLDLVGFLLKILLVNEEYVPKIPSLLQRENKVEFLLWINIYNDGILSHGVSGSRTPGILLLR